MTLASNSNLNNQSPPYNADMDKNDCDIEKDQFFVRQIISILRENNSLLLNLNRSMEKNTRLLEDINNKLDDISRD